MSNVMAWWGHIPTVLRIVIILMVILLAVAFIRWVLTHTVQEEMTTNLMPHYKAGKTKDGHKLSELEREQMTSRCIRVWRTPYGYAIHVTRRLAHGLKDQVLLDAAASACPDGWRHHIRKVAGARWIISDGRQD